MLVMLSVFLIGYCLPSDENQVVYIHWRLLHNVGRSEGRKEWQRMALKVSVLNGVHLFNATLHLIVFQLFVLFSLQEGMV